ncbi:MAG: PcfK-like family protein [Hungatella sp.]|jgi:hypothetical protein|nr:PcfK-like family protein [Hungatella sp.]
MVEKVFGKIGSVQEINAIAADLRRINLQGEIKKLAEENKVPQNDVKEFLNGKRYFLVDAGNAKSYESARSKLLDEMGFLNDAQFGDIIGNYLLKCCDETGFSALVLKNHKTLQRCINYLMKQAQQMVTGEDNKRPQQACVAVEEKMVYQWANEYYQLDDAKEVEKAVKEAEQAFLKRKEPKPPIVKNKKKNATSKQSGKKEMSSSGTSSVPGTKISAAEVKKPEKEDKNQIEGQVSLF